MNELKLIKVSELEVGDEIIISSYSNLKYLKVLKLPKLKTNSWGDYYTNVKCSIKQEHHISKWGKQTNVNFFETDTSKHNSIIYQNLNNRHILLVKRENN
jgi:hypothetical protein